MAVNVYFTFNGNCWEAVDFYTEVFKVEDPLISTYGDMPPNPEYELPAETADLVLHAKLNIEGSEVMFSDGFPGGSFVQGNNIGLAVVSQSEEDIRAYFEKLAEGGTVALELQETFWSKCYGRVTDKFGIDWQLSYEGEEG